VLYRPTPGSLTTNECSLPLKFNGQLIRLAARTVPVLALCRQTAEQALLSVVVPAAAAAWFALAARCSAPVPAHELAASLPLKPANRNLLDVITKLPQLGVGSRVTSKAHGNHARISILTNNLCQT